MFKYIQTAADYKSCLSKLELGRIAFDTETYALGLKGSALDCHTGRISLLITKTDNKQPVIFDLPVLAMQDVDFQPLKDWLLNAEYLLAHNTRFDLKFLRTSLGIFPENVRDTMIMGKLISNATGSKVGKAHGHGYADLCREYLNVHISGKKTLQISSWGVGLVQFFCKKTGQKDLETALEQRSLTNPEWLAKLEYAANDVQYLFPLHDIMHPVLTLPLPHTALLQTNNYDDWGLGMSEVLQREFEFIPVCAEMEFNGLPVSLNTMAAFQTAISVELNSLAVYLCKELNLDTPQLNWEGELSASPRALKTMRSSTGLLDVIKTAVKINKIEDVQAETLNRMLEIIEILASRAQGSEEEGADLADVFVDVNEAELFSELVDFEESDLVASSPIIKAILNFKKLAKQESMDLRKYVNKETGRIHYGIDQLGAATGRSSCIAEGQRVTTVVGLKPIEDIVVGDLVYCYDLNNSVTISKVSKTWRKQVTDILKIKWQTNTNKKGFLLCTPEHRIKTKSEGWVEAQNLTEHQELLVLDTSSPPENWYAEHYVVSVEPYGQKRVYDIEVEEFHNFICEEICVANSSRPNMQQISGRVQALCVMDVDEAWK